MAHAHKPRTWHTHHVHLWGCMWLAACLLLVIGMVLLAPMARAEGYEDTWKAKQDAARAKDDEDYTAYQCSIGDASGC